MKLIWTIPLLALSSVSCTRTDDIRAAQRQADLAEFGKEVDLARFYADLQREMQNPNPANPKGENHARP